MIQLSKKIFRGIKYVYNRGGLLGIILLFALLLILLKWFFLEVGLIEYGKLLNRQIKQTELIDKYEGEINRLNHKVELFDKRSVDFIEESLIRLNNKAPKNSVIIKNR
ncbi:MAG: hypothetical protein JJV93_00320 [Alphaproteobacteria bacterium]|nr:hypothetical protein [Alphaproteobacteria bacterium]MBL0717699.1 hypothetical protein [Alphaproteobacteria bacterium]